MIRPVPASLSLAWASASNTSRRPSMRTRLAVAVTSVPTPLPCRWSRLIRSPAVIMPGGRWPERASIVACCISCRRRGVLNTPTSPVPCTKAVSFSPTTIVASPLRPSSIATTAQHTSSNRCDRTASPVITWMRQTVKRAALAADRITSLPESLPTPSSTGVDRKDCSRARRIPRCNNSQRRTHKWG